MINPGDYEWYGDQAVYNPINDCPERDMTKEEFKEYLKRINRKE